ncbi:cyclic nucleotide-binding protein [Flavobacterium aquidurense]|jgi:CRP-like cAMP-binding protein|uniref:Crp/Fnr family transcriptional regulator n=1 Tax=Flavobacterium aquidurense TaxID=362413 RepID=UPI00091F2A79|nr:Crp/Fnr family transcriptional regulator [Flavobacterium aquidurense]OXA67337.1 cyclic nucleotide-binding protein [Flavobacterium aquidurense]SHH64889.1 cAMP-binding domain of CRP or a regulatory subunit of cAMP-dependent protein kinases [Flavobacterium frigidimaris]
MHVQLLKLISKDTLLSEKEKEMCGQYFEPVFLSKNYILEEEGKIPKYLYFVVSGFVRLFHYNSKGNEVTTNINCPTGFITSYMHFINQTKSDENLECVTECELLRITKTNLDVLMGQSMVFKDFSILVFQQALGYHENRSKELAMLTAEERYRKLMKDFPDILHNVPLHYIASFLGMNPKSLSRIRKEIIR